MSVSFKVQPESIRILESMGSYHEAIIQGTAFTTSFFTMGSNENNDELRALAAETFERQFATDFIESTIIKRARRAEYIKSISLDWVFIFDDKLATDFTVTLKNGEILTMQLEVTRSDESIRNAIDELTIEARRQYRDMSHAAYSRMF